MTSASQLTRQSRRQRKRRMPCQSAGFGKERFDPDFSRVQGFLVGQGLLVAPHPFEIAGMEGPMHLPTLITGGTLRFEWTRITSGGIGAVLCLLRFILHPREVQGLALGADREIVRGVISELGGSIIGPLVLPVRQGNIGADVLVLNGLDVLNGSIFGVASHLTGVQFPAEAHTPEQIEHRLVVHDLGRSDQCRQDDATLASIHDLRCMVAQVKAAVLEAHRGGIGIGRTDLKVGSTLVEAMDFSLLSAFFDDPVMSR